jgi:hypothetical protein
VAARSKSNPANASDTSGVRLQATWTPGAMRENSRSHGLTGYDRGGEERTGNDPSRDEKPDGKPIRQLDISLGAELMVLGLIISMQSRSVAGRKWLADFSELKGALIV